MSNKLSIIVIAFLLSIGLIGELFSYTVAITITSVLGGAGRMGGMFMMLNNGSLKKQWLFSVSILILAAVALIGLLFKITHAPQADMLITIGFIGIAFIYVIHFLRKSNKGSLDILKVIWVIVMSVTLLFTVRHMNFRTGLKIVEGLCFLALFSVFAYTKYNESKISLGNPDQQ